MLKQLIKRLKYKLRFPGTVIRGEPFIGRGTSVGFWTELNAKHSHIHIGDNCDIASFVSINVADSHKKVIGRRARHEYSKIVLEDNVFIGSHCFIKGGAYIGHHSVIAAGTVVEAGIIPPYSLVYSDRTLCIRPRYYAPKEEAQ